MLGKILSRCNFKMNLVVFFFLTLLIAVVVSGGPAWKDQSVQRGSGLKVGKGANKNSSNSRGNGLRLGSGATRTTTTTIQPEVELQTPSVPSTSVYGLPQLHVGMVVPYKSFGTREYTKAATSAKYGLQRKFSNLFKKYDLQVHTVMKELTPSPTAGVLRHYMNCVTGTSESGEDVVNLRDPAVTRVQNNLKELY